MDHFDATLISPFFVAFLNRETRESITLDLLMQDERDWFFPRGRSEVWKHFMKKLGKTETMCSHCKTLFSSTTATTNLLRHLFVKHQIKEA